MEKESLKRTRVHRASRQGEQPCLVCGKPLEIKDSGGYFPSTEVVGGISGSLNSGEKLPTSRREIVICDECMKDVAKRATEREVGPVVSGGWATGSGFFQQELTITMAAVEIEECDLSVKFDKIYGTTMQITWLAGTGELPTGDAPHLPIC